MSFKDLLNKQDELDRAIGEKRDTGFKPRERTYEDIVLSTIAEIIELNEETEQTHKTWKEKKFDIEKAKEEAIDVLFFFLQLVNLPALIPAATAHISFLFRNYKIEDYEYKKSSFTFMILCLLNKDYIIFIIELFKLYSKLGMTKEDIVEEYMKKWNKNMQRIKGDWTNASEKK